MYLCEFDEFKLPKIDLTCELMNLGCDILASEITMNHKIHPHS